MTETKNFYQQFGFHPETIGLRHRHFNIIVEPDEMDQQGGAQAGDICVRARDGAANPMDFEAVRKPNFINTLEDDFDPTYRYYWFRPLSEPMTETKDDAAGLVARLIRAADRVDAIFDPNLGVLWREAADALTAAEARIAGLEAALEPFAVGTDIFFSGDADDRTVSIGRWYGGGPMSQELPRFNADIALTVGDLRRAREALSRQEGGR